MAADLDLMAREPGEQLYEYLKRLAEVAFARRQAAYEALQTTEQIAAYQERLRQSFIESLGGFPERTPLNARAVGELPGDGYRIEKIIFESQPDHHVTAALYLPPGLEPHAAVLVPCGHSEDGKANDPYQRVSILLARNGWAAFCYDPIAQGERDQILDADGKGKYNCTWEHTLTGMGCIPLGINTARYRIWDGIRALDYLCSRPDIDASRLGCTGNSGGGTLTSFLMALDPRIICAAPSCFLTSLRRIVETRLPQDAEQNIYREIVMGMEHADFLILRAPKPTLMCTATRDFFDISGSWDTFRQAKRIFGRLGYAERVDLAETDATHGFSMPLRVAAVRWMRRWLLGKDDAITEQDLAIRPPEELWCTPRGQVLYMPGEKSVFQLNAEMENTLSTQRAAYWAKHSKDEALATVRELIGARRPEELPACQAQSTGSIGREGYVVEKLLLQPEEGITLPALFFKPPQPLGEAYLYLHGEGKEADAGIGGPIQALTLQGHPVLAVDIRGMDDTDLTKPSRNHFRNYYLAYRLGKSYIGMWVEDILSCARWLASGGLDSVSRQVALLGVGEAGPAALHAAALEPDAFAAVTLRGSLISWASLVGTPEARSIHFLNAVHGALRVYDLPDLVRTFPPDKLEIEAPVDAQGRLVCA
jgi:cephalosporin-C deacetylase-like acetyl esterase